jgi:hypothetical protein
MKVAERVLDVTSTLEGERVGMTIDQGALAHIMSVLTDLYADPELAVIREYSTNAFDSHVEAGVTRPIEISLPGNLSPFFKVRDFGVGMDADDIREIYSRYGTSTRRDSNDAVGMLGLGCKSALTYTDQFTVVGIKNGIMTQVSVSRDEDGSGSMTIVSETPTDAEQGVEIVVPAKYGHRFEEKAKNFYRFWTPGTVLVNGKQPARIDGMWIADDIVLTTEVEKDYVVMGNVAYPFDGTTDDTYGYYNRGRYHTVTFVNIGDVNFTPSRESLMMTNQTKASLKAISERIVKEKDAALQKMIAEAKEPWEAVKVSLKAKDIGFNAPPLFKGKLVPHAVGFERPKTVNVKQEQFVVLRTSYFGHRGRWWHQTPSIELTLQDDPIYFVGYESSEFTPYKRQKLEQWESVEGVTRPARYILCKALPVDAVEWINPALVYDWKVVEAQKIIREKSVTMSGRLTGSYDGYVDGVWTEQIPANDIDTSKPLFWSKKEPEDRYSRYYGRRDSEQFKGWNIVKDKHPNCTMIQLGANRIEKFKRDFPKAKNLAEAAKQIAVDWKNSLTDEQKLLMHIHKVANMDRLRPLDPEQIDDPKLQQAVIYAKRNISDLNAKMVIYSNFIDVPTVKWSDPSDAYPLLTSLNSYATLSGQIKSHMHMYLNAAYAARQEV